MFPSLDALPPEAAVDMPRFRPWVCTPTFRSRCSLPETSWAASPAAATDASGTGPTRSLAGLRRLAAVIATMLARKIHEEALDRVVGFERLASSVLASLLIAGPGGEDAAIISGLHGIAGFLGVDRATLWQWDEADGRYRISHRWLSEAAGRSPHDHRRDRDSWTQRPAARPARPVAFARLSDLPPEALGPICRPSSAFGLAAVLAVPMAPSEAAIGAFVLSNTHRERGWPQNVIDGARLLAEVFASLLARRLGGEREQAAERRAEQDREALGHMARVDMLGKLSASIAHQLNQPLAAILANAEAARTMLGRDRPSTSTNFARSAATSSPRTIAPPK